MWDISIDDASLSQIGHQLEKEEAMWSKAEVDDFTLTLILKIYDINPSDASLT